LIYFYKREITQNKQSNGIFSTVDSSSVYHCRSTGILLQ